jgi:hypothetical protein
VSQQEQLEKEKHQSDGRLASDKSFEKKRECSVSLYSASELKISRKSGPFSGVSVFSAEEFKNRCERKLKSNFPGI